MSKTYRITYLLGKMDTSVSPPAVLPVLFPSFDGWPSTLSESECTVTVPDGVTPADLGPLVKVELIPNPSSDA